MKCSSVMCSLLLMVFGSILMLLNSEMKGSRPFTLHGQVSLVPNEHEQGEEEEVGEDEEQGEEEEVGEDEGESSEQGNEESSGEGDRDGTDELLLSRR